MSVVRTFLILVFATFFIKVLSLVVVHNLTFNYDRNTCSSSYLNISKSRGQMFYVNAFCSFIRPIQIIWLHIHMSRKVGGRYERSRLSMDHNLCDLTGGKTSDDFFKNRIFSSGTKYFEAVKCPMKGNFTLKRLPSMLHMLQGVFPNSDYMISCNVKDELMKIWLDMNITFSIVPSKMK